MSSLARSSYKNVKTALRTFTIQKELEIEAHAEVFLLVKKRIDETSGLIWPVIRQQQETALSHTPKQERAPNTLLQVAMLK